MLLKFNFKKSLFGVCLGLFLAAGALMPAHAAAAADIKLYINNKQVSGDQPPIIVNQRTYVPFRLIGEELGYDVTWLSESKQVVINTVKGHPAPVPARVDNEKGVQIVIDGSVLDIPPDMGQAFISEKTGRTLIPLRAVGEALNCEVNWLQDSREVIVNSKRSYIPDPNNEPGEDPDEQSPVQHDPIVYKLAEYRTNIRLLDGTKINTKDLLEYAPASFSKEQLEEFRKMDQLLQRYPKTVTLPDGRVWSIADITIQGEAIASAEQLTNWLYKEMRQRGIDTSNVPENIVELYLEIGKEYGIRGDLAFAQAVKETGYFNFTGHVQPWQNNYCGLWAVGSPNSGKEPLNGADPEAVWFEEGVHGAIFATPEIGVEAHIQHLYAYATDKPLPKGKTLYDPRFIYVNRGSATTWLGLNANWAVPGTTYGHSIIHDYWKKAL